MKALLLARQDLATWIMALGIAFGLGLFLTAVINRNPWEDHTYNISPPIVVGTPAPHMDGREAMTCSSCHVVVPMKTTASRMTGILPIVQGGPSPHIDGREKMNCASCHTILPRSKAAAPPSPPVGLAAQEPMMLQPRAVTVAMNAPASLLPPIPAPLGPEAHEGFTSYRFQGKVVRVFVTGSQTWGDVYILLDDGINPPGWIDLAPRLFLQTGSCLVRPGMFVKGTAYRDTGALAYGGSLMVNGELCMLRDNHLKGLWEEAGGADVEER